MQYIGNQMYKIFIETKPMELSKNDIRQIISEYISLLDDVELIDIIEESIDQIYKLHDPLIGKLARQVVDASLKHIPKTKRSHNKKDHILRLFNEYHVDIRTKKETFEQIARELNITLKAVEKAYYSK